MVVWLGGSTFGTAMFGGWFMAVRGFGGFNAFKLPYAHKSNT